MSLPEILNLRRRLYRAQRERDILLKYSNLNQARAKELDSVSLMTDMEVDDQLRLLNSAEEGKTTGQSQSFPKPILSPSPPIQAVYLPQDAWNRCWLAARPQDRWTVTDAAEEEFSAVLIAIQDADDYREVWVMEDGSAAQVNRQSTVPAAASPTDPSPL